MRPSLVLIASFALACACCANSEPRTTPLDGGTNGPEPDAGTAEVAAEHSMQACERSAPVLEVDSEHAEAVPAGTPVKYNLTITNMDSPTCPPSEFSSSVSPSLAGLPFTIEPAFLSTPALLGGQSATLALSVTSHPEEEAGIYRLSFFVRSPLGKQARTLTAEADYRVREPDGCHVAPARELLIRDPSVVDDRARTSSATGGAWSFGELMRRVTKTPADAPHLVEAMLQSFTEEQIVNGFRVPPRPNMASGLLKYWERTPNGELDLTRAPMRLLAIAHRLDLGEGRFVFGVLTPDLTPVLFTLILEYALPGNPRDWARSVHALQALPFPSADYNHALQDVTDRFSAHGAAPERPHGSSLLRVRTNENVLGQDGRWEMREFQLSAASGSLAPAGLAQTPDRSWNGKAQLASFINDNQPSILRETHSVPALLDGQSFQAGNVINELGHWDASGVHDQDARRSFSRNTCDGCHGGDTFTSFFHVFPRAAGEQSALSTFLTGIVVRDPVSGEEHTYNELRRRRQLLESAVCGVD
jgi:hypothetical protein